MNRKIGIKIAVGLIAVVITLQGGTVLNSYAKEWNWPGFTTVDKEEALPPVKEMGSHVQLASQQAPAVQAVPADAEIVISDKVLEAIRLQDPAGYEWNTAAYKHMMAELQVHDLFRTQLDELIVAGGKVPDILTAYDYIYRQFGSFEDVKRLLTARQNGQSWTEAFQAYAARTPSFVPQAFDSDYLEGLLQAPGLTADDIMIADHISFKTGKKVPVLMALFLEGDEWREQCAKLGLLFSGESLPRVAVTEEQLRKHAEAGIMSEEQAVEAFVLAAKLDQAAESIVALLKAGASEAAIYEQAYAKKFYALAEASR